MGGARLGHSQYEVWSRSAQVQLRALSSAPCVASGKVLYLPGSQSSLASRGIIIIPEPYGWGMD